MAGFNTIKIIMSPEAIWSVTRGTVSRRRTVSPWRPAASHGPRSPRPCPEPRTWQLWLCIQTELSYCQGCGGGADTTRVRAFEAPEPESYRNRGRKICSFSTKEPGPKRSRSRFFELRSWSRKFTGAGASKKGPAPFLFLHCSYGSNTKLEPSVFGGDAAGPELKVFLAEPEPTENVGPAIQ